MAHSRESTMVLFDVDGTLTVPRGKATTEMIDLLRSLRGKVVTGIVGGSDLEKQKEQIGSCIFDLFDYVFSENGLRAFRDGHEIHVQSIKKWLGEERIKEFINFCLRYIADLDIPVKRGTFIEFRNGMINVSPIGRNCNQEERDAYEKFDLEHKIREKFVSTLQERFKDYGLRYSIGGQISFDVFPEGWDKTYCLPHVAHHKFDNIYFFGDKTFPGGNDYEIYTHPLVKGIAVKTPADTMACLKETFF